MTAPDHPHHRAEPGTAPDPPVLTGDDVVLRELRESDIPRIVEACADPVTQKWLGRMPLPYGEDDARAWLADCRRRADSGTAVTWAVADPDTDALIGAINLFDIEPGDRAEIGYWTHPAGRGKGLTTQASRLVVDHGLTTLGLGTIIGHAALDNRASQKVLEASGLRRTTVVPGGTTVRSGPADAARFSRSADPEPDPGAGLHADDVEAHQNKSVLLPRTTLSLAEGEIAVAVGRPGSGHTALALTLAGRLPLAAGQVTLDGSQSPAALQRAVALVDVPGVSEPDDSVPLRTIVGEELAMARRKASSKAVARWLADATMTEHADAAMDDVPAGARVGALARLAAQRPGVRFLVITYPERHGLPPGSWLDLARSLASDGLGVLVTASAAVDLPCDVHRFPIGPEGVAR
ncbi:GNAT family N-acetyltransferase [Nocardioides jensenii]|uniref:GNAT family N-acetyltransferase n=1 Tax=Nocardioides jensenii TaxID=1843 RepID=UPI0008355F24|nr:GNAT family N-acetyltransferase [Nocardioides jensenii]